MRISDWSSDVCSSDLVLSRYFFSSPTLWAFDTTYMIYGAHFMLVAAFALARHDHIRTDFVYWTAPVRWQAALDAALYLLFFIPALTIFLWVTTAYAVDRSEEQTSELQSLMRSQF